MLSLKDLITQGNSLIIYKDLYLFVITILELQTISLKATHNRYDMTTVLLQVVY